MNPRMWHALALTLLVFTGVVRAQTIELVSGDKLSARVISRSDTQVVIDHPDLGRMTLPAAKVKSITPGSRAPAPGSKGSSATAKPAPAKPSPEPLPKVLMVEQPPKPASAKKAAPPKEIEEPSAIDRILKQWDSRIELGLNGTSGNTDTQNLYARFATKMQDGRDRWNIQAKYFMGRADGKTRRNQAEALVTRDWLQKDSPWFLFARGVGKYDQFRAWQYRASGYGGGGYTFVNDDGLKITARAGLGGTYEFGHVNEWTPEAMFSGSAIKWDFTKRQTIAAEFTYFPSLEGLEDYRISSKIWWQYRLDLLDGLSLKIGADDEYESQPDRRDERHDLKWYGAIVLEF